MTPARLTPRRRDRTREEPWIRAFLDRAVWGTLAVPSGDGAPHLNTNLFVRVGEPERLYVHTARTGALATAVTAAGERGVPASFTAGVFGRLLPAVEALEFSIEYASVVVQGQLRIVADPAEATDALHRLLERYAPHLERGRDYRGVVPAELRRTAVYRLDVEAWSGKQKAVGEHPGAFRLADPAVPFEP
ncbi:MAG TPA: pyridoxamine 5'-phosphate oxidase family protein [Longimicrobiales bacterium]